MEAYAAYRVLMVEDDRGIAQAVQTQGELWNLQVRQVRDLRHVMEEFAEFDPPSGTAGHRPALLRWVPLVYGDPAGIPGSGDFYLVGGGQYEHHHGHEPGR